MQRVDTGETFERQKGQDRSCTLSKVAEWKDKLAIKNKHRTFPHHPGTGTSLHILIQRTSAYHFIPNIFGFVDKPHMYVVIPANKMIIYMKFLYLIKHCLAKLDFSIFFQKHRCIFWQVGVICNNGRGKKRFLFRTTIPMGID